MSREVRRVPATWEHPKNAAGHYIPLHDRFPCNQAEIEEGIRGGWLENTPPHYGVEVMPDWPEAERTHVQMYETCSEGTPISPVMETPESLARWLADTGASSFADRTASYEQWLRICRGGYAPSAVMTGGEIVSGVEGFGPANAECTNPEGCP